VVPVLIRLFERLVNYMLCKSIMSVFSLNSVAATYHQDHKEYDFM
jgi:hypothetical protein